MLVKYNNSILNLANSIREYYGLDTYYDTDKDVSEWLNTNKFKHLFLILIDGMGSRILDEKLDRHSFLIKNRIKEVATVYPTTTTAATTSILTGKSPKENAYLGWSQYFKEADDQIILFREQGLYSKKDYQGFINEVLPCKKIFDDLDEKGISNDSIWPIWGHNGVDGIEELVDKIFDFSKKDISFCYAYYDALDTLEHLEGVKSDKVTMLIKQIDQQLSRLSKLDDDCGVIVVADHGQIDCVNVDLGDYPDIMECLKVLPSIEPRCMAFSIKDGMHERFEKAFRKHFNETFALLTKQEAIHMNLFGLNDAHERFEEFILDYLAIGTSNVCLYVGKSKMKGQHSGTKEKEFMVPIITIPKFVRKN